mgnify:CR=1 FL=1
MYAEKLVVAVKCKGKVLRELKDTVYLPFGSEYSLFIKNLNTVRCLVKIEIDGKDIGDGTSFIVPANGSIEIERFVKSGNLQKGNRFRFIERTARVEEARGGPQVEDGLIRVEYEFEREPVPTKDWIYDNRKWFSSPTVVYGSTTGEPIGPLYSLTSRACGSLEGIIEASASYSADVKPKELFKNATKVQDWNEAGITAPGSVSEQKFEAGYIGALDGVKHVMVIRLLGVVGQKKVEAPVTVKYKPKCVTCGKINKVTAKFCSECGTALEIV